MDPNANPALSAFVAAIGDGANFAQLRIQRAGPRFELRHVEDADAATDALRNVSVSDLRGIAMETSDGVFRPLKSAPSLKRGWRCEISDVAKLDLAIGHLYPGGVTDWHARNDPAKATGYRDFTARQTGMYRITTFLDAGSAPPVIAACCDDRFCLKNRRWTYDGVADEPAGDLDLPCLEPCPLLLEFARKAVRISQEPTEGLEFSASELESLLAALAGPGSVEPPREADFADPRNSRRLALLKQRLVLAREKLREQPEQ